MSNPKVASVLVVDDEPEICQLLVDALSAADLHVRTAASGKEAIDLARTHRPDILVTDLLLGDCTGLDVIDSLRRGSADIPAVVITGKGGPAAMSEASRRHPVELMTKPINLQRLREAIREELSRQARRRCWVGRHQRLRHLAGTVNKERKTIHRHLNTTCADLTAAYRTLSMQLSVQQIVLGYQNDLISAKTDDDVFRSFFRLFVRKSGQVHGVALVCDAEAKLRVVGRFGVPQPDNLRFCEALSRPVIDALLANPTCALIDAQQKAEQFDKSIRRYLTGLSILAVPLMPAPGEMIGLVALYRKGEQPFTDDDMALAEMISHPTAAAIRRND